MIKSKLGLYAALFEGAAGWNLLTSTDEHQLLLILVLHGVACALVVLAAFPLLPLKLREGRWWMRLLLFDFCFFIPVVGLISLLGVMLVATYWPRKKRPATAETVSLPEFTLLNDQEGTRMSQGAIRARLSRQALPVAMRLQSLLALQHMPSRVASPVLLDVLGDSTDDVRLVAFGMLDSKEKDITSRIHEELKQLERRGNGHGRLRTVRHLAELYWELVYSGLVRGDVRDHALGQARHFVDEALALAPENTGLLLLQARILDAQGEFERAEQILSLAVLYGLPKARALPYLAEIAFERHDIDRVKQLMDELASSHIPKLQHAIAFWTDGMKNMRQTHAGIGQS